MQMSIIYNVRITAGRRSQQIKDTNGKYTVHSNGTLVIHNVTDGVVGTYLCVVKNGVEPGLKQRVKLAMGGKQPASYLLLIAIL